MQPANTFGDDASPQEVTYHSIAQQVRTMNPRALSTNTLDDVVTIIEYMRDACTARHDLQELRAVALMDQEKALNKRERDVTLRGRAIDAMLKTNAPRKIYSLWRR